MLLNKIGEFGFIKRFSNKFDDMLMPSSVGIGDDCAVIPANENEDYVVSTDMLIEDTHFIINKISAQELGAKALAVNLSDIAAMGATPISSFLSIGIPKSTTVEYLDNFMEGYYQLSKKYNVPLMGGDTTKSSDKLVINITVMGKCAKGKAKLRSMAEENDIICVTGNLGDSSAGLKVILDELDINNLTTKLINAHNSVNPRIKEGIWLGKQSSVNAMIDISDGISSDLIHILEASKKSATIDINNIPISDNLRITAKKYNWNIFDLAISGGEDYELLLIIKESDFKKINLEFQNKFSKSLINIGKIKNGLSKITWLNNKNEYLFDIKTGFNHF